MPQSDLIVPGNIDLTNRPRVRNDDGSISTVRSIGVNIDGREVLIPTVVGTRVVSDDEAVQEYKRTGKHLGVFATSEASTAYAQQLHQSEAKKLMPRTLSEPEFNAIKAKILDAAPAGLKEDEFNRYVGPALAGAIGEAENSPEPLTGSVLGRFAAGAWKNLNPAGLVDVVAHPIDTASAIVRSHLSEADKARQAFKEGRYSEAMGHAAATALPVIGPAAARAGERIGEGDIAGGIGEGVGVVGAMESPRALRAVPAVVRAVANVPVRAPVAATMNAGAAVLDNPVVGTMSPRLRNVGESLGKGADLLRPKPTPTVTPEAIPADLETAQEALQRMSRERWLRGPEEAAHPKTIVQAATEVQNEVKASKLKLSAQEYLAATQIIATRGVSADEAIAAVKLARGLPTDAEVASVVAAKNARTAK